MFVKNYKKLIILTALHIYVQCTGSTLSHHKFAYFMISQITHEKTSGCQIKYILHT